jgi:hypothetical protein
MEVNDLNENKLINFYMQLKLILKLIIFYYISFKLIQTR